MMPGIRPTMITIVTSVLVAGMVISQLGLLAPASAVPSAAAQVAPSPDRTITVSGEGAITAQPDQAIVRLGVEETAPTAAEALMAANQAVEDVLAELDQLGIPRENIQTVGLQLMPIRADEQPQPPREPSPRITPTPGPAQPEIVGFRAVNQLAITVPEIDRVGEVLDAAVTAGANQILGVSFEIRDLTALKRQALQEAVQDARAQAEAAASALGLSLGLVLAIRDEGGFGPGPVAVQEAQIARGGAVPIEPGQLTVRTQAVVTFGLVDGAGAATVPEATTTPTATPVPATPTPTPTPRTTRARATATPTPTVAPAPAAATATPAEAPAPAAATPTPTEVLVLPEATPTGTPSQ